MSNDPFWNDFFSAAWCETAEFRPAGLAAGTAGTTGTTIRTLSTAFAACDLQAYGSQEAGRVFFLPPACAATPGDRIVYRNRNYDLRSVRSCINAHGETLVLRAVSF